MVGHDAVVPDGGRGPRRGRPVVVGLGVVALLAVVTAALVALLGAGSATAQTGTDPGPEPYGGQLEQVNEGDRVTSEQVLEVGMLGLGTLNGVAFVIAMVASRLRGPSTAQTRRALIARTGAGVVSESRRERRQRLRGRSAVPGPATAVPGGPATATGGDRSTGGPSAQAPRTPPSGTVPAQGGPAPREGLVPAGRAPLGPPSPPSPPSGRPGAPVSPPSGVPSPIRPSARR